MIATKNIGHMAALLMIAGLLYVNFMLPNDALSVCVMVACCVYLLTCQPQYVIPSTIFFSFFAKLFRYGNYLLWVFIVGFMVLRALLMKERGFWTLFIEAIVYVFLQSLCIVVTGNLASSGTYMPVFYGLFLSAACYYYHPADKKECLQHYMWGFFVSSVLGMFVEGTRLEEVMEYDHFITTTGESVSRFCGLAYDCNFYGVLVVVALFLLLFENETLFRTTKKALWYVMLMSVIVFGLLSYSKAFLLTMILLLILACIRTTREIRGRIFKMIPLACLAFVMFSDSLGNIVRNLIDRFSSTKSVEELTTGRSELWILYLKVIFSDMSVLLFGAGMKGLGLPAAHNLILEIWSRFGIAGLAGNLFHLRFSARMMDAPKTKRAKTRRTVLGLVLFVILFSLSAYHFESLWILIFIAIISGQEASTDRLDGGGNRVATS